MRLLDALSGRTAPDAGNETRFGMDTYAQMLFDGNRYVVGPSGSRPEDFNHEFVDYVQRIHRRHGVVAAAVATRALLMSQVRFQWRRPDGSLYGNQGLRPLERPGSTTRPALLSALEHDASYAGTAVVGRRRNQLWRLAPDRIRFVLGSNSEPSWDGDTMIPPFDATVTGIIYDAGKNKKSEQGQIEVFAPGEFAVWAPEPDPVYFWKGTSWVTSVVREVLLDGQATDQSSKYFENGSIPSLVFMMDSAMTPENLEAYQKIVDQKHGGVTNRYKNLFLGGATDVKVVGTPMDGDALGHIQGTFENRVAVRSRIPAVVLGTKEALSGSSLNSGNYAASRRLLADGWFAPTVDSLCAALEAVVSPPGDGSELGHDMSRVLFLQEDQKDAAEILQTNAVAMRQWVEAGYDPQTVTDAVSSGDITKLKHTGNVSVQLQPPGTGNNNDDGRSALPAPVEDRQSFAFNFPEQRYDIRIPDQIVNVNTPEVHNHVDVPEVRMDAPVVNVSPTPVTIDNQINVDPTPVTVDVRNEVEPTPVSVTAQAAAPTVNVQLPEHKSRHKVRRDRDGRITEVVED